MTRNQPEAPEMSARGKGDSVATDDLATVTPAVVTEHTTPLCKSEGCGNVPTYRVSVLGGKVPPIRGNFCGGCVESLCARYPDRMVAVSPLDKP